MVVERAQTSPTPQLPAATGSGNGGVHTVQRGDTLSGIAARNGVTLDALKAANPQIQNASLIFPGDKVNVPGSGGSNYTVQRGDTLAGIAQRTGTTLAALDAANPQIKNINRIYPGDTVKLPAGAALGTTGTAPATTGPAAPVSGGATPAPNGQASTGRLSANGQTFLYNHEAQAGVSNRLHWPKGASGVTLGPGYDMKGRSAQSVVADLTSVGVPQATAQRVAQGAGLSGAAARDFAASNRNLVSLTRAQEMALMQKAAAPFEQLVRENVRVPITQNQFDALVSFAYNIGPGGSQADGFTTSTALRRLNAGDARGAAEAMTWWNKSGGAVVEGLVNRRRDEVALFTQGAPSAAAPAAPATPAPANNGTVAAGTGQAVNGRTYAAQYGLDVKSSSVALSRMDDRMVPVMAAVAQAARTLGLPKPVITSGNDSTHMNGSLHYSNKALDFRGNNITTAQGQRFEQEVSRILGGQYDVKFETFRNSSNNHLHVEFDPN